MNAQVVAVCISKTKGERKTPVTPALLVENHGIRGDVHAGSWHRQVSLLAQESIEKTEVSGLDFAPGDFAENITTIGIDLTALQIGTELAVGETLLSITQIGKECHSHCAIYYQAGNCVMQKEGVFARVLRGGMIKAGDAINVA